MYTRSTLKQLIISVDDYIQRAISSNIPNLITNIVYFEKCIFHIRWLKTEVHGLRPFFKVWNDILQPCLDSKMYSLRDIKSKTYVIINIFLLNQVIDF